MKKVLAKGLALAFVGSLFMAGSASATPIAFDVADDVLNEYLGDDLASSVSVTSVSTFLDTDIAVNLVSYLDDEFFSLNTGDTATFDFFDIAISGTGIGVAEIEATLAFDIPEILATGESDGGWVSFFGIVTGGGLIWDDSSLPDEFVYAGQLISVDFNDLLGITLDSTVTVTASVTNLGAAPAPAPVPEPATMLLFGSGLAGLAGYGRRKARKK